MKKVFHFDSQIEKYHADACVVSCFDARFELVTRKFIKKRGILMVDPLKIAGGAKVFASPGEDSARRFALNQVQTSMRLHGTNRVLLMVHTDCSAYGGLAAFDRDEEREAIHHQSELRHAGDYLKENIPSIEINCFYLGFTGVWVVEGID
jgi:carbonic anhydrase